jgi:hypothetical protein
MSGVAGAAELRRWPGRPSVRSPIQWTEQWQSGAGVRDLPQGLVGNECRLRTVGYAVGRAGRRLRGVVGHARAGRAVVVQERPSVVRDSITLAESEEGMTPAVSGARRWATQQNKGMKLTKRGWKWSEAW